MTATDESLVAYGQDRIRVLSTGLDETLDALRLVTGRLAALGVEPAVVDGARRVLARWGRDGR